MTADDSPSLIGTVIGSWRITARIGRGGMGTVWSAAHLHLDRRAAVKVLSRELAADANLLGRFFDEARAASIVAHPGIVHVLDCGLTTDGLPFIVMELLHGVSLGAFLDRAGALSVEQTVQLGIGVASALAAAHAANIVHRDLKPDNIFVLDDSVSTTKVLDFGIAKLLSRPQDAGATISGVLMGTPRYMSPEQCRGTSAVDHRADIYALGCVLFEALAGRPPFTHDSYGLLVAAHLTELPRRVSAERPEIPAGLDHLIDAMLAKEPGKRPQTMEDVIRTLKAYARPGDPPTRDAAPMASARGGTDSAANAADVARSATLAAVSPVSPVFPAAAARKHTRGLPMLGAAVLVVLIVVVAMGARIAVQEREGANLRRPVPPAVVTPTGNPPAPVLAPESAAVMPDAPPPDAASITPATTPSERPSARTLPGMLVRTQPSGARVCREDTGAFLGRTPLRLPHGPGAPTDLVIQMPGHAARHLPRTEATGVIRLRRLGPDDLEDFSCAAPRTRTAAP